MPPFTPARRRGAEILDDPATPPAVRERSQRDVVRSNTLLGGARAYRLAVRRAMPAGSACTLLDVGAGLADLPARVAADARSAGGSVTTIAADRVEGLLRAGRARADHAVCADALALPFRDGGADIVACSQLLHHFERADAVRLVREMHRVARRAVVVSDLRRSWVAAAGFWLVSFPLRFHRVTRHDGALSVLRGFTAPELAGIVRDATGAAPDVRRHFGFRLTATVARA
ncbi:MAG TPA: methyltransferase domain-containing protein [Gemmatimonadaceae bacterium]|nr:methyltransferase domain-containing protein [Gemmatimonadaceae bacterium]